MNLQDILAQYAGGATGGTSQSVDHFDTAARELPPNVIGQGVADAMRSDQTPPFGQMVGQIFGQSNPQQQASVLNQLLGTLGPGALTGVAGGLLGRVLGGLGGLGGSAPSTPPSVTPTQASQLSPEQVSEIATHAEKHDPTIIDRLGEFYGQHPQLVRTLGSAALAIALGKMANRTNA